MGKIYLSEESSAPGTPSSGTVVAYFKADGLLYYKDDAGTERAVSVSVAPFDYDNRFSNPNGTIDQRKAGAAVTVSAAVATFGLDRWQCDGTASAGTFTIQRETTDGESCILLDVGTADASLAAGDIYEISQKIEGTNVADLRFGTGDAKYVTVSFEVKCSITGTFPVAIRNSAANRSYVSTFAVNAANTWETKSITFLADTSGTWLYSNLTGVIFTIGLGVGSTYNATSLNTWEGANKIGHSSCTNWMADAANTMRLRKFRMRAGIDTMPFVPRPFDVEFLHCQRYYETNVPFGIAPADGVTRSDGAFFVGAIANNTIHDYAYAKVEFKVTKRTSPTMTYYRDNLIGSSASMNISYTGASHASDTGISTASVDAKGAMAYAQYDALAELDAIVPDFWWAADAEL